MRYFSMFSGIGGFEKGIEDAWKSLAGEPIRVCSEAGRSSANDNSQQYREELSKQPSCIGFSEIDKKAINIYKHHFPGHHNYGSAFDIKTADLPDFDFLVGGFPCQAFSIAGKRLGFQDTRGTLFFEIARILSDKRPRNFLLENVKGLLSHDEGKTFQTILGVLSDLGYWVEWQVLNSKNHGVPQNRERVFFVGHLGGEPARKVFPIGSNDEKAVELCGQQDNTNCLKARYEATGDGSYVVEGKLDAQTDDIGSTLTGRGTGADAGVVHGTITGAIGRQGSNKEYLDSIKKVNEANEFNGEFRIRRLTPIECERLQGFPDDWTKYGADGKVMSDSARYKACGNAVTTNVIRAIVERLFAVDPEIEDLLR